MQASQIIRDILEQENITITELSQKLDVSISSLSNKLNRQTMKYSDVQKILHILGYELIARKKDSCQPLTTKDSDKLAELISSKVIKDIKYEIAEELGLSLEDIRNKK